MQKKLIALAIASLAAPAFAQSNVTISGSLDAMYTQYTNDKDAGAMLNSANGHGDTTHKTNRIAFKGTEDLGNGMKAFFELEERFNLDTGAENVGSCATTATGTGTPAAATYTTNCSNTRFGRSSWVGLQGGFGMVYLGRTPTAGDMVFGGGKIASNDTIADWASRKGSSFQDRQANGVLYRSPKMGPLSVNVSTAVKERNDAATPLGLSAALDFGRFFVEGAWQKDGANARGNTLRNDSVKNMWVNGGVKLGDYNVYAYVGKQKGYQSYDYTGAPLGTAPNEQLRYAVGADAKIGANGKLFTNIGVARGDNVANANNDTKYTAFNVAYQHNLSKRTSLIAAASYEREGYQSVNGAASYTSRDEGKGVRNNRLGMQVGVRHAF
jgi:predicted porin